jgi:hypothetical protein
VWLQIWTRRTDPHGVLSIRAARRYRWRLAGGRLIVDGSGVRFVPNQLERRRSDAYWACTAEEVTGVHVRAKVWLVVGTADGTDTFRVFRAATVARMLTEALNPAPGSALSTPGSWQISG